MVQWPFLISGRECPIRKACLTSDICTGLQTWEWDNGRKILARKASFSESLNCIFRYTSYNKEPISNVNLLCYLNYEFFSIIHQNEKIGGCSQGVLSYNVFPKHFFLLPLARLWCAITLQASLVHLTFSQRFRRCRRRQEGVTAQSTTVTIFGMFYPVKNKNNSLSLIWVSQKCQLSLL